MIKHEHLIARAELTYTLPNTKFGEEILNAALHKMLSGLGMKVARGPDFWYCTDEGNEGWTVSCIITTSHIVIHTWDKLLQLDVYTCSDLDIDVVYDFFQNVGGVDRMEYKLLDREHGLHIKDERNVIGTKDIVERS